MTLQPRAVELEASSLLVPPAIFERRILAPHYQRNAEFHGNLRGNGKNRHVHRHRGRAEAHQRIVHEFPLDLRIDLVVDVVHTERYEVIQIALPDVCASRRSSR